MPAPKKRQPKIKIPIKEEELICVPDQKGELVCAPKDQAEIVETKKLVVSPVEEGAKEKPGVNIGTLNLFSSPAQKLLGPVVGMAKRRYHKHYHPRHKHGLKHLVADLFFLAGIIFLVAFNIYLLVGGTIWSPTIKISLALSEKTVKSGEDINLTIDYHNNSETRLDAAKLSLKFPEFFVLKKVEPATSYDQKTNTFDIGNLEPEANGQVKISGQVLGGLEEKQDIYATLNYVSGKFAMSGHQTEFLSYTISDSALSAELDMPKNLMSGQSFHFNLNLKNSSVNDFSAVMAIAEWPKEMRVFDKLKFDNQDCDSDSQCSPQDFSAHGVKLFSMIGAMPIDFPSGTAQFKVQIFAVRGDKKLLQREISQSVAVVNPKFIITEKINGQDNINVKLGEPVEYTITYDNQGEYTLYNVLLADYLNESDFLDDKSFVGNGDKGLGMISWSSKEMPELAIVRPGDKGKITFKVNTLTKIDLAKAEAKNSGEFRLLSEILLQYRLSDSGANVLVTIPELASKISSDLNLTAFARYYTDLGDQLGRGPLPPKVGQETRYWIFWHVLNSLNVVNNVVVSGVLPDNVSWTGKSSVFAGDKIVFDAATRKMTWQITQVERLVGEIYPSLGASFELVLTPVQEQIGKEAILISKIMILGVDSITGQTLEKTVKDVTTNLLYDKKAGGKGMVR